MTVAVDRRALEARAIAKMVQEKRKQERSAISAFRSFYDWQAEFTAATATHIESCLCAANQIGKTFVGTDNDAMHLLGDYPEDWPGHRFDFPPLCWGLGFSMEKTRDLLQTALFGEFVNGEFQGGLVPKDRIIRGGWEGASGTKNAMRTVRVKHRLGISMMQFWSYSQGQHAIMGDIVDWFHMDEEAKDQSIRPQLITRTANGDRGRGGRGIYTFTPENGRTDLVVKFMDDPSPDQFFMMKGWDDAPHMTPEKRERLLGVYPDHQRDMRSKGIPMLGHGRIYDLADEFLWCDPFEIPDHFFVINGMDFGWDHPQAHIKLAEDRDNGIFYITNAWRKRMASANDAWGAVKQWSEGVPCAWPSDGLQGEKARDDSKQTRDHYSNAGFEMLSEWASWPEGGNSREVGLFQLGDLKRKGKFRIFKGLNDYMDEVRQYHRDERGNVVRVRDDLLDAARYAYMMRRHAIRVGDVGKPKRKRVKAKGWGG